jgi:hypothetical protein
MTSYYRWETRQIECPEEECRTNLLLTWDDSGARPLLRGVHCDNPRLRDLDNWECRWSCWDRIAPEQET